MLNITKDYRDKIIEEITNLNASALLGIDGMIDEVWELIESRKSPTEFDKLKNMRSFGEIITQRSTGGLAQERILKRRKCGGFVANTGRAVAYLGADTVFLGMFGDEPRDELFDEFNGLVDFVSVGDPANIMILEFMDGKIMMPNLNALMNFKWQDLVDKIGNEKLAELFNKDIVGVGYWSNMHDFKNIINGIADICEKNGKTKRMFHDFANLKKRTSADLKSDLLELAEVNKRVPQTLSLNEHEGAILAAEFGIYYPENINDPASLEDALKAVEKIQEQIKIDEVVIHTSYFAVIATATNGSDFDVQNYCENPVITTGAGDTFNGGYMVAALTNLSAKEKLMVANLSTYHYVSTGRPVKKSEFADFVSNF